MTAKLLFRKGMALIAQDKLHEALTSFGEAEQLDPKNQQIQQSIGMATMKLRKKVGA